MSVDSRIARPVGAELKFERDARNNAYSKVDEEEFAPEFRHRKIQFVPCPDVAGLHDGHHNGKAQGQRNKKEMEVSGCGKL